MMVKDYALRDHNTKLMRLSVDGNERVQLHNNLCSTVSTLDLKQRKLYLIDECAHGIEETNLDASSPRSMVGIFNGDNQVGFSHGLGQYGDECYYTQRGKVFKNGVASPEVLLHDAGSQLTLGGLVVVHPSKQPPGEYNNILGWLLFL